MVQKDASALHSFFFFAHSRLASFHRSIVTWHSFLRLMLYFAPTFPSFAIFIIFVFLVSFYRLYFVADAYCLMAKRLCAQYRVVIAIAIVAVTVTIASSPNSKQIRRRNMTLLQFSVDT